MTYFFVTSCSGFVSHVLKRRIILLHRSVSFIHRKTTFGSLKMSASTHKNAPQNPREKNAYKKTRLRGHPSDQEEVRISKTLSWVLRHGAKTEGLFMRKDGYVRVNDLLALAKLRSMDFQMLERIVQHDAKSRYHLLFEPGAAENVESLWWIRANQGHTLKEVDIEMNEITDAGQVPMAVHGTNLQAWKRIQEEGLSPMKRAHIHLAQYDSHVKEVSNTAGLRSFSQILIYVDVDKALRAGIKFYLSSNGVILTKGDTTGYLRPEIFKLVTDVEGNALHGWNGLLNSSGSAKRKKSQEKVETTAKTPVNLDIGEHATFKDYAKSVKIGKPASGVSESNMDESLSDGLESDMKRLSVS